MGYFLDTFALVELLKGHPDTARFRRGDEVTSLLNLCELFYYGLSHRAEGPCREVCRRMAERTLELENDLIEPAMRLRQRLREAGRDLSYIDAIGYSLARHHGYIFVSSEEFEGLPGVEVLRAR
ncbi:MAG: type II toxin-antitoxin system VapC family toxin [Halobacteria archaeon]